MKNPKKKNSLLISILIFLSLVPLAACGTSKEPPVVVSGKEYVYPRYADEWLEPCTKPKIPVRLGAKEDITTRSELLIFVTELMATIDCQVDKQTAVRNSYTTFLERIKTSESTKKLPSNP